MRVLLSCLQGQPDYPIPAYAFWRSYFVNGLKEAGHECIEVPGVDWAEALVDQDTGRLRNWRTRTWEQTMDFVRSELSTRNVDLFISYFYPKHIEESAIKTLQRWGIPCVNFFCDNVREFRKIPPEFRCFDLHWVPEFEALPMYRAAGLPHINLPMPCWVPPRFRDLPDQDLPAAIFIGSGDLVRRALLADAMRRGANIELYGRGWEIETVAQTIKKPKTSRSQMVLNQVAFVRRYGHLALANKVLGCIVSPARITLPRSAIKGPLPAPDYFEKTRSAAVTIGINRLSSVPGSGFKLASYSRLRDIEAPMLGACYITERTAGLPELYNLNLEIETYVTGEELAEKIRELFRHPQRRARMRRAAQLRALNDHSVARSIDKIAQALHLAPTSGL